METRGVKKGTKRKPYVKYTDEEIIDVLSKYETIRDLRTGEDGSFYFLAKRRDLDAYLPAKRTKAMNIVGSAAENKRIAKEIKDALREEKKIAKAMMEAENKESKAIDKGTSTRLYMSIEKNGKSLCGRCLVHDLSKGKARQNKNLCQKCYNKYMYCRLREIDSNPHNIKDEYCHIDIRHHEKIFHIGIVVDKKTQDYLSMIGYSFIFKEEDV